MLTTMKLVKNWLQKQIIMKYF
uniref:Uncharacterized protein n=1 Tax=Anguilla anguilla TaxID=7936 RepID=A0A0E9XQB8_ANGAN